MKNYGKIFLPVTTMVYGRMEPAGADASLISTAFVICTTEIELIRGDCGNTLEPYLPSLDKNADARALESIHQHTKSRVFYQNTHHQDHPTCLLRVVEQVQKNHNLYEDVGDYLLKNVTTNGP